MAKHRLKTSTLLFITIGIIVMELLGAVLFYRFRWNSLTITGWTRLFQISLICFSIVEHEKNWAHIGLAPWQLKKGFIRGAIWCLGCAAVVLAIFTVMTIIGLNPLKLIGAGRIPQWSLNQTIYFFLIAGILAPIAEELFFRGVIFTYFRQWGQTAAFSISIVLFLLAHQMTTGLQLTQFVGGILFTLAYAIENKLIVPIMIHVSGNSALFLITRLF